MTKKLTQMHGMQVFHPIEEGSLTHDEKKRVLSLLMFPKEKRDILVKVHLYTDGCKTNDGTGQSKTLRP